LSNQLTHAVDSEDGESLPDQSEFNIPADFRPKLFENRDLRLKVRYANVDVTGENDSVDDIRLILNYYFTAL